MPLSPMSKRSMDALGRKAWSQRIISTHIRTSCLAGIGIGLPILATNRIILLCTNATVVYALTLRCYLHLWASRSMDNLVGKGWSKWIISTHMSTSCHAGIGIGLPILAANRIVLLCTNATVVDALSLGCYLHLRARRSMHALVEKAWITITSTHMSTSCHTGIWIGLPILATNRIILLCANATVVNALALRCHFHLNQWITRPK